MNDNLILEPGLRARVERCLGETIQSVSPGCSGANSLVCRIETASGPLALKSYPVLSADDRPRAQTEWAALHFLRSQGLTAVPAPVAKDPLGNFLVMEWVDGAPVDRHSKDELIQAADFLTAVFALSDAAGAEGFPPASGACLSVAEIIRQIEDRISMLEPVDLITKFLEQQFFPALDAAKTQFRDALDHPEVLARSLRRLIPADFGFHNALRRSDGSLVFIDFDYFGWDDPVKLTADFILHPAMDLSKADTRTFAARMQAALPGDRDFAGRLRRRLPLYALRWSLIILNPFRLDRNFGPRVVSSAREGLLEARLRKAKSMLSPPATGDTHAKIT